MEDLAKVATKIIDDCENTILNRLFETIGKRNLISVILIGSIARNTPSFKSIDGIFYLESDLDVVIVSKSVTKYSISIKRIANRLTTELRKQRLLSSVSLSIMTEHSLRNSLPTIIYHDLVLNGKVIFGQDLRKTLTVSEANKIPVHDIYRLVFNRMVEALDVFVSSGLIEKKLTADSSYSILNSIEKLTFALIQAILIKKNILIFRGYDLNELQKHNFQQNNFTILKELLASHEELKKAKESQEKLSGNVLRDYWGGVIRQFNSALESLAYFDNVRPLQIQRLILRHEKLGRRLKLSSLIFLQYFGTAKTIDLFRTMVYRIRFGSDYVYIPLYYLFLSTEFLYNNKIYDMTIYKELESIVQSSDKASSVKSWMKSFNRHLIAWKLINL